VLIPQQRNTNNATLCFNWFSPLDQSKDKGEIASIINMINHVKNEHNIPSVYIFGLSAGGAMAVNLMSHYPESFDAGVIVAGISYPCADSLVKAISCMKSGSAYSPEKLNQTLQNKKTTWPNMIIVTGNEDNIVNPINASQMAQQWRLLHKVPKTSKVEQHQGYQLQSWGNGEVSLLEFDGLGHGLPVKPNSPTGGTEAPFFIAAPISIAEFAVNSWLKGN
jgi:poly(hydroxyalkanoate) depolymerase family esterase